MKSRVVACAVFAFISMAVAGDGVLLFRRSPSPLPASEVARIAELVPTKSIVAIDIDPKAMESTIINVELDGKAYRFVGSKRSTPPSTTWLLLMWPPWQFDEGFDTWEGKTTDDDIARIGKGAYGFSAEFNVGYVGGIGGKTFRFVPSESRLALVEIAFRRRTRPID